MGEKHADTEHRKHVSGGPGKAARKGHRDPEDTGNAPGQKQAGREHRTPAQDEDKRPPKRSGRDPQ